jgi:hypothetical protein
VLPALCGLPARLDHLRRNFRRISVATAYLAQINATDYEMVRGILNDDLPDAYEKWFEFQAKGESDGRRQGHTLSYIPIDPNELARYCGAHGGHRSHHGLLHFVMKKSQGEKY